MHLLVASLEERLKRNVKLHSVIIFMWVSKIYLRGGDEGREWRGREERGGEGKERNGKKWKEKDKGIKEMGRRGVGSKLRGGSVNKLRRTENN